VPHLATPRKTEHTLEGGGSWTLRSAGGARPALVVWGDPQPGDPALDRLARAGFGVITPSSAATPPDLVSLLEALPRGALGGMTLTPVGVLCAGPGPDAGAIETLEAKRIPWRRTDGDWDGIVSWFAARLA